MAQVIRKVGMVNIDLPTARLVGSGGFAGASNVAAGVPSGSFKADFISETGVQSFVSYRCIAAKIEAGLADLVFAGIIGGLAAKLTVHLDALEKRAQAVLTYDSISPALQNDEQDTLMPKLVEFAPTDMDKAWEYIYVLIHSA